MGNRSSQPGYSAVPTDEEAPATAATTAQSKLPVDESIEPIARAPANNGANGSGARPTDVKKEEKSRFSSDSLKDTVRILKLVIPFVWPKDSTHF